MEMPRRLRWPRAAVVLVPMAVLAAGCGGGGGGGGGGTPAYTVTATASTGGIISPQTARVQQGSTASFTVSAADGYSLQGVSGCGGSLSGNTYTTGAISADCTVSATFTINRYQVTTSAGPGGTISPTSVIADHGSVLTFTLDPNSGFVVDAASGCGGSLQDAAYVTGPLIGPCQVAATFRQLSVSGTVIPGGGTAIDSDVNDPLAPFVPNDTLAEAQLIPNPATLGGYVNTPGAGAPGRSFEAGDELDIFQVELFAAQTIALRIASDDAADDLDLYLADRNGEIIDASLEVAAREESLVVPAGGEYLVIVNAAAGASNYLLHISQPNLDVAPTMRLSDAFVPGELIVLPASEDAPKNTLQGLATGTAEGRQGAPRNRLVRLDARDQQGAYAVAGLSGAPVDVVLPPRIVTASDAVVAAKLDTLLAMKRLAVDPAVASVTPNYLHELGSFTPNDVRYPLQWHYPLISMPQAWSLNTGMGAIVAVIDSGVFLDHPDLAGRLVPGYDFILGAPGGNDPGENPIPPGGSNYHGTHVAGTIAAATDNAIGVAGVAFGARIMPLRVCTATGCPAHAIEQGLRFAAGLPNDSGTVPAEPADVINLSLGRQGGPALAAEQDLYDVLRSRDILVVSSAGNSDTNQPGYPAAYANVWAVSAVDIEGNRAFYSNFGAWIDVAAPGGDLQRDVNGDGFPDGVLSTYIDDRDGIPLPRYAFLQGTSMASPHVAGVLALMRSAVSALSAQDIEALLRNGALTEDLGATGRDDVYGYGLINAAKAVSAALNTGGEPVDLEPFMTASPRQVNFGTGLASVTVVLSNSGGGELVFGPATQDSGSWLSISAQQSGEQLILTLVADRSGLEQGIYSATVTVLSDANTVEIPVVLQVADVLSASIGLQYVLLADPDTLEVRHGAIAEPLADGRHAFRIDSVSPGDYLLFSGSDANNDGFICDSGESCGIYRTPGDIVLIRVIDEDVTGLEFTSGYELSSTASQAAAAPLVLPRGGLVLKGFRRPD
jgi:serine protease